jgi:hypothetical protein
MFQARCVLEWNDEGRIADRLPLDGVARIERADHRRVAMGRALDVSEGGLCVITPFKPTIGERLGVEVGGLRVSVVVRNVRSVGKRFRVGGESEG